MRAEPSRRGPFSDQYTDSLPRHYPNAMGVADQHGLAFDRVKLHQFFDSYGIVNISEIYHGAYPSVVTDHLQNPVMPFFSRNLCYKNLRKL